MARILWTLVLLVFVCGCSTLADRPNDPAFDTFSNQFLDEYWKLHPEAASAAGLAQYDSSIAILDESLIQQRLDFYQRSVEGLSNFSEDKLSLVQIIDRSILLNKLEKSLWQYKTFKAHEWNPAVYNIGDSVSQVLEKSGRTMEEKLKDLSAKLLKVNQYYQAAKNNIRNPTREHTNLAISQNRGLAKYLMKSVLPLVKKSKLGRQEKSTLEQRLHAAKIASRRYGTFLKGVLAKPEQVGGLRDFRLGEQRYGELFEYEMQIDASPKELYKKALRAKEDIRGKIFETAIGLYPKYFGEQLPPKDRDEVVKSVMKKVIKKYPSGDNFTDSIREQMPELTAFVKSKNLLTLDPKKPLIVRETPLYQRGTSGISIDAPGPYDKDAPTYYNVTPLTTLTPAQRRSFLREYNSFTLQILNIHEAIPGHYVQLIYSNQAPSQISSVFSNTPLVEGWASYAERMMLEEGYGEDSLELWLMYYKWHLRAITNTILDYEIHVKNLSRKDAMKMLIVDAYQEKAEAEGKWNRAIVTQVQLASYFAGYTEIYELREAVKKEQGMTLT